jgi:hypothetical protein
LGWNVEVINSTCKWDVEIPAGIRIALFTMPDAGKNKLA